MSPFRALLWAITITIAIHAVSSQTSRRRSQNPYPPPLHLFPGPSAHAPHSPNRHMMSHRPQKRPPPFRPLPNYHTKPYVPKYQSSPYGRPYVPKKPYTAPPIKKQPYHGSPYLPSHRPIINKPYNHADPPKETIATFVDRPTYNHHGTPKLTYTHKNKNPTISYGPPYPPKPFKSYGVPNYDEEESQQYNVKYPVTDAPEEQVNFPDDPIFAVKTATNNNNYHSVQFPTPSSSVTTSTYNSVQFPSQVQQTRRRKPASSQRQSGISYSTSNDEPREAHNYDEFLRESFTQNDEPLRTQETKYRRPASRIRDIVRPSNHQYEVTTEAEERISDTKKNDWTSSSSAEHEYSWQ